MPSWCSAAASAARTAPRPTRASRTSEAGAAKNRRTAISHLERHADEIRAFGATSLYLFGSSARDEAAEASDLDLFVDYDPESGFSLIELVGLKQFLEDRLATRVDLTTRDSLHPMLRDKIERSARKVF